MERMNPTKKTAEERVVVETERGRLDEKSRSKLTADALLHSPLVGMWSDRSDITDSSELARKLRDKAGTREK